MPLRCSRCLKARSALFCLVLFGLVSFLAVAAWLLLNSNQEHQLPRCWVFEADDDGTCDKVTLLAYHLSFLMTCYDAKGFITLLAVVATYILELLTNDDHYTVSK